MKIKAFTLIEVIVAMLLSGIVVALAIVAFQLVGKQFLTFKKSGEKINEQFIFHHQLHNDVKDAELIMAETDGLKFIFGDNKKVEYIINEENIIRSDTKMTDTFLISNADIEINNFSDSKITQRESISYFSIIFNIEKDTIKAEFYKDYAACTLLKYKFQNNHQ